MKKNLILSGLMAALASAGAMAGDANITFSGTVSASTCTLAAADASKTLTMPSVSPAALYAAGASAYGTYTASDSFHFSACPAGLTKVISNYTYQGSTISATDAIPIGTATNLSLLLMQSSTANASLIVNNSGTSGTANQATITSNVATVPITVGIRSYNSAGNLTLSTVGTYSGVYTVAFTYS